MEMERDGERETVTERVRERKWGEGVRGREEGKEREMRE